MKKVYQKPFGGKNRLHPSSEANDEGDDSDSREWLDQFAEVENARLSGEQLELVELLREGFSSLSDMQKRVLMLMVDQNCTQRKAAKILGIHHATLINHLNRARKKLMQYVIQARKASIDTTGAHDNGAEEKAESGDVDSD